MEKPQSISLVCSFISALPVAAALWAARFALPGSCTQSEAMAVIHSSSSVSSCCFKCRRAAFLIARRCATTASFSIWRSRLVRGSAACGRCFIFGRSAPTFRSFGFAYGSIKLCYLFDSECRAVFNCERPHLGLRGHVRAFQSGPPVAGSPHAKVNRASCLR